MDTTAPEITVPDNIQVFATGPSGAIVNFTATATDLVDGDVDVTADPVSGATFPLGMTIVTLTATDAAGNTATETFMVTVTYDFDGFFQPVDMNKVNSAKAGSAIPIKFSLGGDMGLDIMATEYPRVVALNIAAGTVTDEIETTVTAGSSKLTYDPIANQYIYVWKTEKAWAGQAKRLIVKLSDGTTHFADFQFKK